jgi:hypothetical protein
LGLAGRILKCSHYARHELFAGQDRTLEVEVSVCREYKVVCYKDVILLHSSFSDHYQIIIYKSISSERIGRF